MSDGTPSTEARDTRTAPMLKPGYRTTEGWLTLFSATLCTLYGLGTFGSSSSGVDRVAAFLCASLAVACYSISRGLAKRR